MQPRDIYIAIHAHTDPVGLRDWREGIATTLATLRDIVQLCHRYPQFRCTQNEALPSLWAELYAPELLEQIRQLVSRGQWHISGGWYLQPDCTLPCGEAMVRHILLGHRLLARTVGLEPTVALNTEALGHNRGLVQILVRSGYRAYLFRSPLQSRFPFPHRPFLWEGIDGSRILALCIEGGPIDAALTAVEASDAAPPLFLWEPVSLLSGFTEPPTLEQLQRDYPQWSFRHTTPDTYCTTAVSLCPELPVLSQSLRSRAVGTYTTNIRLKQLYRRAEQRLLMAELMATCAAVHGLLPYPAEELHRAWEGLLFCQSSAILGGTATESSTAYAMQQLQCTLGHAEELLFRSFAALTTGQPSATPGELPILVYNPHPYPVTALLECEFQSGMPNYSESPVRPQLLSETGQPIPCQALRPDSHGEHRIRILFRASLHPQRMHRFRCYLRRSAEPPSPVALHPDWIRVRTAELDVWISRHTGLLEHYRVGGREYARAGMGRLLVVPESADAWGLHLRHFRRRAHPFRPLPKDKAAWFAGVPEQLHPIRIIEQGEVCTIVEVLLHYRYRSFACLHYLIPHEGSELELRLRLLWNERDSIAKLAFPTRLLRARCYGQGMFAIDEVPTNGSEHVAQCWICLIEEPWAFSCLTESTYGVDYRSGELRLSLVRSPASAGPSASREDAPVPSDRFTARLDQGEHCFRFWINAGQSQQRLSILEREAQLHMQPPIAHLFFPSGGGSPVAPVLVLDDPSVVLVALKQAEDGSGALIIRLWEPTGQARRCNLHCPAFGFSTTIELKPYALATFRFEPHTGSLSEVDLLERPLGPSE